MVVNVKPEQLDEAIREQLESYSEEIRQKMCIRDRYLVQDMKDAGFHMDDVYQGTNLTPILIEFEGKLKDGRIIIGDNGLLQSHLLNVAVDISLNDSRMKPVKIDRRSHIDGSVAVFDAFTVKMKYYNEIGRLLENRGK